MLLPLAPVIVACGNDSSSDTTAHGGAAAVHAGSFNGGAGLGGLTGNSGGGPKEAEAGAAAGGNPSGPSDGRGGASAGDAGASAAGMVGSGGGGGADTGTCTRSLLEATLDAYFAALAAHDPAPLPLAASVKLTENGTVSQVGEMGLWKTSGSLKYAQRAFDVEQCMAACQAVISDGTTDIPVALRLKLQSQEITEIESIAARAGDYPAVASNPGALAASDDTVNWERAVPAAERATREELTGWMTKYFTQFPAGVCNTSSGCIRLENGGGSFSCAAGASCSAAAGSARAVLNPRLVMADVETGIGVGFTLFTGGYADMHMFKMRDGQVQAVSAILAKAESSGWD